MMTRERHISQTQQRLRLRELETLTARLATAMRYTDSAQDALDRLARDCRDRRLALALTDLRDRMTEGMSLSAALAQYPECFSPVYVRAVAAGEERGDLDAVLRRLQAYVAQTARVKSKVRAGLLTLGALALGVVSAIVAAALCFAPLVRSPLGSQFWLRVWVEWLPRYAGPFLVGTVVLLALGVLARRLRPAAYLADCIKDVAPFLRPLTRNAAMARFCHALGLLLACGVPADEGLDLAAAECGSLLLRGQLTLAIDRAASGKPLIEALAPAKYAGGFLKPGFIQAVSMGEKAGSAPQAVLALADVHEHELSRRGWLVNGSALALAIPLILLLYGPSMLSILTEIFDMFG